MQINEYGAVFVNPEELFESLYSGRLTNFKNLYLNDSDVDKFNQSVNINKDDFDTIKKYSVPEKTTADFDKDNQHNWFMPKDYCPSLISDLYEMCSNDEQKDRVSEELEIFAQHNMIDLLFYLKYLVDTMRQNNIVWGVGRGSSVASYVLYLIGVHKIDSLKYELDIREFLK